MHRIIFSIRTYNHNLNDLNVKDWDTRQHVQSHFPYWDLRAVCDALVVDVVLRERAILWCLLISESM